MEHKSYEEQAEGALRNARFNGDVRPASTYGQGKTVDAFPGIGYAHLALLEEIRSIRQEEREERP